MRDDDFDEAMQRLSVVDTSDEGWSRRDVLKAALAAGSATGIGLAAGAGLGGGTAHAATPGNLLLIQLGGGNDGFNTMPPIRGTAASLYRSYRGSVAITDALPARMPGTSTASLGFHPSLAYLAQQYRAGKVAVVNGVGYPSSSLSHFEAIATWMAGTSLTGPPTSGWIGRWLDGFDQPGLVDAVQIGSAVPLHLVGTTRKASSIDVWEPDFGTNTDFSEQLMYQALGAYAGQASSRGVLADRALAATNSMMSVNRAVKPLYSSPSPLPDHDIVGKLTLAARLFNTGLGVRVISTVQGDFDQHDEQLGTHGDNLAALDAALRAFFTTLTPSVRRRTVAVTFSEFGRKPHANASRGTDHGKPSVLFVVGDRVNGGMHGTFPSLAGIDVWEDAEPTVDFRSVYATVLKTWLRADPRTVLGRSYPQLKLFRSGP